jgi:hypothetical protein
MHFNRFYLSLGYINLDTSPNIPAARFSDENTNNYIAH